jgi:glycosyltransferase involved in cell wall biosynthesis
MQTVRAHHPAAARFIVLSDAFQEFPDIDLAATLWGCEDMGISLLDNMKLWYNVVEFNTAIKPFCFQYFFSTLAFDEVCYLDPDIFVFSPLVEVFDALTDHSCVLTPHMMHPLQDGKEPSDLTIMKSGVYNLGFLALKHDGDALRLLRWWSDRLFSSCRIDIPGHMFTDQRWMDLAPALVPRSFILKHPGYNVAYWNLPGRVVDREPDGRWTVDGRPLTFFHFSGIKPDDPKQFSKHQNRYTIDNLGIVAELCTFYRKQVLGNKWLAYSKTPYAFGSFKDGRPIDDFMRHWIARAVDEKRLDANEPLEIDSAFFDQLDSQAVEKGARLTRFMYQFWLDRKDLQDAFNVYSDAGLEAFVRWFLEDKTVCRSVDGRSIAAAQSLRTQKEGLAAPSLAPMRPRWSSVAAMPWTGKAADVGQFFRENVIVPFPDATVTIPKQAALLWERRIDLQAHFRIGSVDELNQYICWALTQGILEGSMQADLLPTDFLEQINALSSISSYYNDVPITAGMVLTRKVTLGRRMGLWQQFPTERASRIGHGLWYAFVAPTLYGWPPEIGPTVRAYFQQPSGISVDGYQLSRGLIAIWEMRPDVQQTFPLSDRLSVWRFVRWFTIHGLEEFGVTATDFDPKLVRFLAERSPRNPRLSQLLEMTYDLRDDLQSLHDITTGDGLEGLIAWSDRALMAESGKNIGKPVVQTGTTSSSQELVIRARIGLTGYWSKASGRGEDIRCSAQSLRAIGFDDFIIVDLESQTILNCQGDALEAGTSIAVAVNIVHTNADTAYEDWQLLGRLGVVAERSTGFWAWELERLPSYWRHAFSFYDEIWAATRFAEKAFAAEGLRPVSLVPMAVLEPALGAQVSRASLKLPDSATIFLSMFDFRSFARRKNPEAVVAAFKLAFPDRSEDVRLIIKTQGGSAAPTEWKRLCKLCDDPRIELRDIKMDRADLLGLIRSADAFVSLHRSEGFGRGPAEAMLFGVPTILTDYSGTCDFANSETALLVDYDLVQVDPSEYPGVEGQCWADARADIAARQMRWLSENRQKAKAIGTRGRDQIIECYAPARCGAIMLSALAMARVQTESNSRRRETAHI